MKIFLFAFALIFTAVPATAELKIQQVTSPGGIKAWLVEEHSIPIVSLDVRFKGGTSLDEPGKSGAIYLMSGLLEEGAGDLTAQDFLRKSEELASSFGFRANGDSVNISAEFLRETTDETAELLRLALQEPHFDPVAVDRVRAQVISIIASDLQDPQSIASARFDELAYGAHPYGTPSTGTTDSVNLLTRDDLIAAHRNSMTRDRMFVGVVGDITAEDLGVVLDNLLGGLPETGAPMPVRADVNITGGVTVVDLPTPQSVAVFGHAGISQDDPDFFAAYVMNQVFGAGGFTSRLTEEVREKRGLTYGVYSYLASYDLAELYLGGVSSSNETIAEAIDVIRAEWQKMAENGVTKEELEAAKKYMTGAYPLRFDGNSRIAGILVGMQMDDLPRSYIANRNGYINAVTLEDVARVAKRLMKPENLRIVVVGAPENLVTTD